MGGDLVGMSTVLEAIAAHHCGIRVAGVAWVCESDLLVANVLFEAGTPVWYSYGCLN